MDGLQGLMSIDQQIKDYIKRNEGYNPNIYNDTKIIPTTGYGFNIKADHIKRLIPRDVLSGKRALTKPESDDIFEKVYTTAVSDAESFVGSKVFNTLPSEKKQVLIDMSYNMGGTKLRGFERMREALISGDMATARKELLDSNYARYDVPNRAMRNANLIYSDNNSLANLSSVKQKSDFDIAFAKARKAGLKEFDYKGKKIKVEVK